MWFGMQFPRCYLRCAMQNTNIGWTHRTKSSFGHWVMSSLGCNAFLCVVILQRTSGHVFQGTRVRVRMCMRVRTYACAHMCVYERMCSWIVARCSTNSWCDVGLAKAFGRCFILLLVLCSRSSSPCSRAALSHQPQVDVLVLRDILA